MPQAPGPLAILEGNPIYFTADGSTPVLLAGPHTWASLQDFGGQQPEFDFGAYLELLAVYRLNMIRLWCWPGAMNPEMKRLHPHPWPRTDSGRAQDRGLRFDVCRYDQRMFIDRLRRRVELAGEAGIYVMVMLTDWYSSCQGDQGGCENGWSFLPSNCENNVNGVDDPLIGDSGELTEFATDYVRRWVDELNDLDNVLWEIGNEIPTAGLAWETAMVGYLRDDEQRRAKQHLIGVNTGYGTGGLSVDQLIATGADFISLPWPSDDSYDPPPACGRPVLADTDHINYPLNTTDPAVKIEWAWKSFTRGMHPLDMEAIQVTLPGYDPGSHVWNDLDNPAFPAARQAMADVLDLFRSLPLADLSPRSDGFHLASDDPATPVHVVYNRPGDEVTLDLSAATGDVWWQIFDPRTGSAGDAAAVLERDSPVTFAPPIDGAWVLVVSGRNPPIPRR